jgi:hypothetical protein
MQPGYYTDRATWTPTETTNNSTYHPLTLCHSVNLPLSLQMQSLHTPYHFCFPLWSQPVHTRIRISFPYLGTTLITLASCRGRRCVGSAFLCWIQLCCRTWLAVGRRFGSRCSIFCTRSCQKYSQTSILHINFALMMITAGNYYLKKWTEWLITSALEHQFLSL